MKINNLIIHTSNLIGQITFYMNVIGLELTEQTDSKATFRVGNSAITFIKSNRFQPYHFAINIPSNKEYEALDWLRSRVEILKHDNKEIQDFGFWNAKAIYFYDKDKNIVELIARKNLKNDSEEIFSANSLLEISEIGVPVNDIEYTYNELNQIVELEKYDGGFERFCAIGNENGLFICINKKIKDWFPTGDKANSSEFEIEFSENGVEYKIEFKNEKIMDVANN